MGQKIQLSESQLRNLIKESVKKAIMSEISSDMIGRARDKFIQKYGDSRYGHEEIKGDMEDKLEVNRFHQKLHPKDKRPTDWHLSDFDRAHEKAKMDENPEIVKKAQELVHKVEHWGLEEITERYDYHCGYGVIYGEAKDENGEWWSFRAGGNFDDGEIVDVDYDNDIEFESPNGFKGTI